MASKYHKFAKFGNQHCYYSHVTGQIFTEVVLSTFSEEAKKTFGLLEKFDSLLEARVYSALKVLEEETNNSSLKIKAVITRQVPVEVKPKTEMFNAIIYKADFQLNLIDMGNRVPPMVAFIEAKGIETPEYRLKMKFLQYYNPQVFHAIAQVTDKPSRSSVVPSISLKEFENFLISLIQMYFNLRMVPSSQDYLYQDLNEDFGLRIAKTELN